jgi:MFS family permease
MADGVLSPQRRWLTIGLIAGITLVGFEILGVTTAMPEAARELGGETWYGSAFALAMLGQLVGNAAAGADADRNGPRRGYLLGMALLALGLVLGSVANHIGLLLITRLIVGLGAGAVFTLGYVTIGLAYPEELRPRILAAVSSAWVVPGLVGPSIAGWVTDTFSWRWVLAGVLPIVPIAALIVSPAMRGLRSETPAALPPDGQPFWSITSRHRTGLAAVAAMGAAAALGGLLAVDRPWLLVTGVVIGSAVLWWSLRGGLVPRETLRAAPGLGSVVLASAALIGAFSGAEAFVPLALQRLRDLSSTGAGVAISAGTVTWFIGSWLHSRNPERMRRVPALRGALCLLASGIAAMGLLAWSAWPTWIAILVWGVAGLGQGLVFNTISERPFLLVDPARVGVVSAAVQVGNSLGAGITVGVGGALVAAFERGGTATAPGIAWAMGAQVVVVLLCALTMGRMLRPGA